MMMFTGVAGCDVIYQVRFNTLGLSYLFIYLFVCVCLFIYGLLGLRCCAWAFPSCGEWGLLFVAVCGLLIAGTSLVAEHGLWAHGLQ